VDREPGVRIVSIVKVLARGGWRGVPVGQKVLILLVAAAVLFMAIVMILALAGGHGSASLTAPGANSVRLQLSMPAG
jgi:hypothetical protein